MIVGIWLQIWMWRLPQEGNFKAPTFIQFLLCERCHSRFSGYCWSPYGVTKCYGLIRLSSNQIIEVCTRFGGGSLAQEKQQHYDQCHSIESSLDVYCVTGTILSTSHVSLILLPSSPFYKWSHWGPERLYSLPKVREFLDGKTRIGPRQSGSR